MKLVTKQQAADTLAVSTRTIERMVSAGQLTRIKVRGAVRFRLDHIDTLTLPNIRFPRLK